MKNVLHFPRHKMSRYENLCTRCGGIPELDLPTDCPGSPLTDGQTAGILDGTVDYMAGYGWVVSGAEYPQKKTSSQLYLDRLRSSGYTDVA